MGSILSKWFGKKEGSECPERNKCLDVLHVVLDGEATPEQKEYLEAHIGLCLPCLNDFKLEEKIKKLLQSKCSKVEVPPGLMEEIKSRLSEKAS